jgi:hypothetical protein
MLLCSLSSDCLFLLHFSVSDSPGVPPSANAHELFRGFSFIAPCLLEEQTNNQATERQTDPQAKVYFQCACICVCVRKQIHKYLLVLCIQ